MALSDTACRTAKAPDKPTKFNDGNGLYLLVKPNGAKLWRFDYAFAGKRKTLALGPYPTVTLGTARAQRENAKRALKEGRDPGGKEPSKHGGRPFKIVAEEWLKGQAAAWVPAHLARVQSRFAQDVYPYIGETLIGDVSSPTVLEIVRRVEERGALDVARRIRQSVSSVFRYAMGTGECESDPAAVVIDAMRKKPRVKHMPALRESDLPEFFTKLRAYDGEAQTRLAIEFVAHTFPRTKEIRFGRWAEIKGNLWRIPEDTMKMRKEHLIPLSPHAMKLLDQLREIAGDSELIVPDESGRKPISENTMLFAIYRMGYHSRATIHGLRSTASTILNESGLWRPDAIERQLAHVDEDEVRSAYNAALYLDERTRMMNWYSDFLLKQTAKQDTDLSDILA